MQLHPAVAFAAALAGAWIGGVIASLTDWASAYVLADEAVHRTREGTME